jgi:hypothetical protein
MYIYIYIKKFDSILVVATHNLSMIGVNGVIHPSTWTKHPSLPNTYTAKRMVPVKDVNIEPLDREWPPLKSAVEFCSLENVGGKYEVVGALLIADLQ